MSLHDIAPRLARARDQMVETERVLGWLRDNQWTGGAIVQVPCSQYTGETYSQWVTVDRVVQGDAAPYPIRGRYRIFDHLGSYMGRGQWAFWEVEDIHLLSEDYPELLELHPDFPRPLEATR